MMSIFRDDKLEKEKAKEEFIKEYEENREQQIIRRYHEDCSNNEKIIKPFSEIFKDIVGDDKYRDFQDKTGLGTSMFYALRDRVDKEDPTSKGTIVSVCVGYNVGLQIAEELLRSQGSSFNPHGKRDSAYIMLLTEYRGKTVEECNELLEKLKIPKKYWLGIYTKKPRKTKNKI